MTGFASKRKMAISRMNDEYVNDAFKHRCLGTQLKFSLFPKKCYITGRTIWLETAYKQTAMWTGPGDPVFEHRWYDKNEFVIAKIKGIV